MGPPQGGAGPLDEAYPEGNLRPHLRGIEDDMYMETLLPLLKSKYKSIKAKNDYERSMKLIRFALGRGYSMDVIHKCIDKMKEEDLIEGCDSVF